MGRVVCPSCKWEQIGGEECQRCGVIFARYKPFEDRPIFEQQSADFEQIEAPRPGLLRRLFRILLWVSPAIAILSLFLMFNLATPPEVERDPEATARAQEKLATVQAAIHEGSSYRAEFTEAEINSIVMLSLRPVAHSDDNPETRRAQEALQNIRDLRIKLQGDHLALYLAFRVWGKTLTLTLNGTLGLQHGQLWLNPEDGKLGSLPLPRLMLDRMMREVFDAPENRESFRLPDAVDELHIEDSQLVVSLHPSRLTTG